MQILTTLSYAISDLPRRCRLAHSPSRVLPALIWMLFASFVMAPAASAASSSTSVMIVFDGSGSMWGKLAGNRQYKLDLASKALQDAIAGTKEGRKRRNLNVGLMSFGHRRTRDCTDTGILQPLGPFDAASLISPLKHLNPRGRGPFTRALREAADQLADAKGPGSIILIHDGIDNCHQDPCAFAANFARRRPGSPVHVVSIGLNRLDFAAVGCISRLTGGRHFDAQTAGQLNSAIASAWNLAINNRPGGYAGQRRRDKSHAAANPGPIANAGAGAGTGRSTARAPAPGFSGSGLLVRAALGRNRPPLAAAIKWRVLPAGKPSAPPLHQTTAAALAIALPPAKYVVEARYGLASARKTVIVPPGQALRTRILLNAGALRLSASAKRGEPPLDGVTIAIVRASQASAADARAKPGNSPDGASALIGPPGVLAPVLLAPALQAKNTETQVVLPAGKYIVRARRGMTTTQRRINLTAGSRLKTDLILNSGILHLRATAASGRASLDNVLFTISEIALDAPDGRREISRSVGPQTLLTLPAGTYFVTAQKGLAQATTTVAIEPGHSLTKQISIPMANLILTTMLGTSPAPATQPIVYKLTPLNHGGGKTFTTSRRLPRLTLAPGRYRIESRIGSANAALAYEVALRSGQNGRLTMRQKAGLIRFRLTSSPGGLPLGQVFWNIVDSQGNAVRQSIYREPSEVLAAGNYIAKAAQRGRHFQRAFTVSAGDNRTVELLVE